MHSRRPHNGHDEPNVLAAIRTVQERKLTALEVQLIEEHTNELDSATHRARMSVLNQLVATFRKVMEQKGNPDIQELSGSTSAPPGGAGLIEKLLFNAERRETQRGWPLAAVCVPRPNHTESFMGTRVVAVSPDGSWWIAGRVDGNRTQYLVMDPADLDALGDPAGFLPIAGDRLPSVLNISGVRLDDAVVETIAELIDRNDLHWPAT